ncbi:MAG: hypothetical protein HY749_16370 [Gammaproteobacteria bacterium]|nr:hypothetical protein [Gammaproteobacteria bacterium]
MRPTIYVNSEGGADNAPPYVRDAITSLQQRASAQRSAAAAVQPTAAPGSYANPLQGQDQTSIMGRVKAAAGIPGPGAAPETGNAGVPQPPQPPQPGVNGSAPAPKGIIGKVAGAAGRVSRSPVGRYVAPIAGAAQAIHGLADVAGGDTVNGVENTVLGGLTAIPATAPAGIIGNVLKTARDAALGWGAQKYVDATTPPNSGSRIVGPALAAQLNGKTPERALIDAGHRAAPGQPQKPTESTPAPISAPAAPSPASLVDNGAYVPPRGTGIIRNNGTGAITEINGSPAPEQVAQAPSDIGRREPVNVPNAALATDIDTLPQFLQGASEAGQALVNNKQQAAKEAGLIRRAKAGQEYQKGETELGAQQRLDHVLEQLTQLNDQNDPQGAKRAELQNTALTLRGHVPTTSDTPEDRYRNTLTKGVLPAALDEKGRTDALKWVDQQMADYRERRSGRAAAPQYEEGKVYVDGKGNRAKYQNGQWVAAA